MENINFGFICDVGGKPKGNQDSAFINEFNLLIAPGSPDSKHFAYPGIVALVADGVSGSDHGEKGSTFVIRYLSASIINDLLMEDFDFKLVKNKLGTFIKSTNSALLKKFQASISSGKVPKSTLVGLMIIGQYLWCFNLGDSRAFLLKDDKIGQISKDHIGTGAQHEITQAMGQEKIEPAIGFYNWAYESSQDTLLLSCNLQYLWTRLGLCYCCILRHKNIVHQFFQISTSFGQFQTLLNL